MGTFSHYEAGLPGEWDRGSFVHPRLKQEVRGKLFLREILGLDGMEVSLNRMEPGQAMSFLHRHKKHEELYLFLSGTGEFHVDGKTFPIRAGSAVRVSPGGARAWRNNGAEPLVFVCVQATSGSVEGTTILDGERAPGDMPW
jgi:mannose-6-phosphate isomerase-like protein (cupin superfamily)